MSVPSELAFETNTGTIRATIARLLPSAYEAQGVHARRTGSDDSTPSITEALDSLRDSGTERFLLIFNGPTTATRTEQILPVEAGTDSHTYWRVVSGGSRWHQYVAGRLGQMSEQADRPNRPSLETLNRAWALIDRLLPPSTSTPSVTPSDDGGLELFWQKRGWDIELEIDDNVTVTVWGRDRKNDYSFFGSLEEHQEQLLDVLGMISTD